MPQLILHTGTHKTGTTSLQKAFHDNRDWLARASVLYPVAGLSAKPNNWGHHELAYALRDADRGKKLWAALRQEADTSKLETVFVSSEELSHLPFPTLPGVKPYQLIADCFAGYDITLLCYLRPQADLAASLYNHHVKSVGETRDILAFLANVAPRLEYAQYLNVAAAGLGLAAIRVRRYGPAWLDGDIIDDIAAQIGLALDTGFIRPKRAINLGLTATGMAKMLEANHRFADKPNRLKQERQRILAAHPAGPHESHDMLGAEARRTIKALYRFKNIQIGRRYLKLDGDLFDPASSPIAFSK